MKTIIYILLPIIFFLVACEEDSQQSPKEEIIEEILYYEYGINEDLFRDSIIINNDYTHLFVQKKVNNIYDIDTILFHKDVLSSFIDTVHANNMTSYYLYEQHVSAEDIIKSIDIEKFAELKDTTSDENLQSEYARIVVKTNYRTISKLFTIRGRSENIPFVSDLFKNMYSFITYNYFWSSVIRY